MTDNAGLRVMARLMVRTVRGEQRSIAALRQDTDAARSTVFDVARRAERAGLIARDRNGQVRPGPAMAAYGLAVHGLAHLAGPADAILRWLSRQLGVRAALTLDGTPVMSRGVSQDGAMLTHGCSNDPRIALACHVAGGAEARTHAAACLAIAANCLEAYLPTA